VICVAYIASQFPSSVEPYVVDEIRELRSRGIRVIACSARRPQIHASEAMTAEFIEETLYLQPFRVVPLLRTLWLCMRRFHGLRSLFKRVLLQGKESRGRRIRGLLHTILGAYYAVQLEGYGVEHIHAHHGYFASWIAMVAARMLDVSFSMTLHGSDLLLHRAYLETKLRHCKFCITVSEFNRRYILEHYPEIESSKIIVRRIGVDLVRERPRVPHIHQQKTFVILSVGRLHPVKDHPFLLRACAKLKSHGMDFICLIAGEGPERSALQRMITELQLARYVELLGHLPRAQLNRYYAACDLVVLTSRSEGIPLVLMEAMAFGKTVLAPEITGIPEIVVNGRTGFLYRSGSMQDFVGRLEEIRESDHALVSVRRAARQHVMEKFNREKNLAAFADLFVNQLTGTTKGQSHEDFVLQQI